MADLGGCFNSEEIDIQSFEAIPAGWYNAEIIDSEWKATASGNGKYLQFKFRLIEGQYENRQLSARLNLDNPNETARNIAKQHLAMICKAVNVLAPRDSAELHHIPLAIHVVVQKSQQSDDFFNDIHGYKQKITQSSQGPATGDGAVPPWQRK